MKFGDAWRWRTDRAVYVYIGDGGGEMAPYASVWMHRVERGDGGPPDSTFVFLYRADWLVEGTNWERLDEVR